MRNDFRGFSMNERPNDMLSIYFSIFVMGMVTAAFLFVSYIALCGMPHFGRAAETAEETKVILSEEEILAAAHKAAEEKEAAAPEEKAEAFPEKEETEVPAEEMEETVSEETKVFTPVSAEAAASAAGGATRIFTKEEVEAAKSAASLQEASPFPPEPEPQITDGTEDENTLETYFIRHFLNQYGAVSRTVADDTETVTHELISRLSSLAGGETVDILQRLMVEEALQNAQRSYAMTPEPEILSMVSDMFIDAALGKKNETKTLLACDALKAMPRMDLGEFRALSLLLLFHYSRNETNVDAAAFRSYAARYVEPLMEVLPDAYSGYQQLEYLHCVSLENKDIAFGEVLRDSYPLVFAFRGFMKSEIEGIRKDWPEGAIVPSVFNSYMKPAAVDDSMLPELFERCGIEDGREASLLSALVHSRPAAYDRRELAHILADIAPSLSALQDAWDNSLLRRSSLTLMGMYIAKTHLRALIGEDFDLSHWM